MGAIFHGDCPHCGKSDVQFMGVAIAPNRKRSYFWRACSVFLTCNHCKNPIYLIVEYRENPPWSGKSLPDAVIPVLGGISADNSFRTLAMFPAPKVSVAPEGTPDAIAGTFIEAMDDLKRKRFDTCGILCRKVLDTATKRLKPDVQSFFSRIEALRADGTITPAMTDWAHIVRQDGNEAVHTEEAMTEQAARELMGFTEMFLIYVYSLPSMIEARRKTPSAS